MRTIFILVVLFLQSLSVMSQNSADSVYVNGNAIKDGYTGLMIPTAKVSFADTAGNIICDSIPFVVKKFEHKTYYYYFAKISKCPKYVVKITAKGYDSKVYELETSYYGGMEDREGYIDIPEVEMFPTMRANDLGEASVTASKVKMVMKGDTIEYNATAFRLAEGSMLDNLIRALPGAELSDNGRITVNGKFVSELLVNGRDFFKGDPMVALANLPAYTVNKIQVYHKGEDKLDGKGTRPGTEADPLVMDVRLKREYAKGLISNYEAGIGSALDGWDTKWLARVFAMHFSPVSSLAVYANANNLNAEQQPGRNGEWNKTDIASGRVTTKSAGVDFSRDWKEQKAKLSTTLTTKRQNRLNENTSFGESYFAGGNTFNSSAYTSHSDATSVNWKGRFEKSWNHTWLSVHPTAGYTHNSSDYEMEQARDNAEGREVYTRRHYGDSRNDSWNSGLEVNVSNGRLSFGHFGRMNASFRGRYNSSRLHGADADFVAHPAEQSGADINLRQRSRQPSHNYTFGTTLTPLNFSLTRLKDNLMMGGSLSGSYDYSYDSGKRELQENTSPEDETEGENLLWELDRRNSYHTTEKNHTYKVMVDYSLYMPFVVQIWLCNTFLNRSITDRRQDTQSLQRNDYLFEGNFLITSKSSDGEGSKYSLRLRMNQEAPRMLSMLDILDSADPMWQRVGNSDLGKTTFYMSTASYTHFRKAHDRRIDLTLNYTRTDDAISTAYFYDQATGITKLQPQNIDGNFNTSLSAVYSRFLDRKDNVHLSNTLGGVLRRSADYSSDTELLEILKVNQWNIYDQFRLRCTLGAVTLGAKADVSWNRYVSLSNVFAPFDCVDLNYGVSCTTPLLWGIDLQTDLMAYSRHGYETEELNTTDWVWNLSLSKGFGKGKAWVVKARGYDILQQLPNVRQYVNAQGRSETRYNTIPSYAVISLTYRFDIKPKR